MTSDEGPLPGDRVVVRGGLLSVESLRLALIQAMDDETIGRPEITFFVGGEGETAPQIAARVAVLSKYRKFRQSTVGSLRGIGLELVDCDIDGHCQIVYGIEPQDADLLALANTFGQPEENPAYKGK